MLKSIATCLIRQQKHGNNLLKQTVTRCYHDRNMENFYNFDRSLEHHFTNMSEKLLPKQSQSLAYYVNISKSLQSLITFGVKLHKIEKTHPETLDMLTKLRVKEDLRPKLVFLHNELGIKPDQFADIITKCPQFLDPENEIYKTKEIVDYFASKKFTKEQITEIVLRLPTILCYDVIKIDATLGFLQNFQVSTKQLRLQSDHVREMIMRSPSLLTQSPSALHVNGQFLERSFGLRFDEIKKMITTFSRILLLNTEDLELKYMFMIREMEFNNEEVIKFALIFNASLRLMEHRHGFLKSLGKAQYKADKIGYLSPIEMFCCNEIEFMMKLGFHNTQPLDNYIKTL